MSNIVGWVVCDGVTIYTSYKDIGFVVAEKILYISSIGFCLLAAEGTFLIHHNCNALMKKVTCPCYSQ